VEREHILLLGIAALGHGVRGDAPWGERLVSAFRRLACRLDLDVLAAELEDPGGTRTLPPALIVLGVNGAHGDPEQRIRHALKARPRAPVVVAARDLSTDDVVRLVRSGVSDVVGLPADPDDVAARALGLLEGQRRTGGSTAFVGLTPAMRALRREVEAIATSGSTVLVTGETGTGKGMVARHIHELSGRSGPLVHVDCAALSPGIVESELFGHERGAFTGAHGTRLGRFEQATNGTIFLDEIGDLDPGLQAKLLRVLQERQFERIGGTRTLTMNARVVAATHQDLGRMMRQGRFRPDLYYRIRVIELHVPPLRERQADIPLLVRAGIEEISERLGRNAPSVSSGFIEALEAHHWPGNVRELLHLLERLLVRGAALTLEASDLAPALGGVGRGSSGPEDAGTPAGPPPEQAMLEPEELEDRTLIAAVLQATAGNVSRAARRLGITRSRLRYRIAKYGLEHLIPDD